MPSKRIHDAVANYHQRLPQGVESTHPLMAVLNNPSSNYAAVVAGLPPEMALRLLTRVNQGGERGREVRSVHHAVQLLGYNEIRRMLVSAGSRQDPDHLSPGFDLIRFQRQAHLTATVARMLGMVIDYDRLGDLVTAGLLQNIGKVVIAVELRSDFQRILHLKLVRGLPTAEAERQVLGVSHADVGAMILRRCRVPRSICQAVQEHNADDPLRRHGIEATLPFITQRATRIVKHFALPEIELPLDWTCELEEAVMHIRSDYRYQLAAALRENGYGDVFPQVMERLAASLRSELRKLLAERPGVQHPAPASVPADEPSATAMPPAS
jgi:HD-like signal output (HDOD) protein